MPTTSIPPSNSEGDAKRVVWLAILAEFLLCPVAAVLGWALNTNPVETLSYQFMSTLIGVGATIPLLVLFWFTIRMEEGPLAEIKAILKTHLGPMLLSANAGELFLLSLCAGVGEELLFRGVLQPTIALHLGHPAALAIASAIFGACHWVTRPYAIIATVIGLYLGVLWLQTGNLLVPILVHTLYDFVALCWIRREVRLARPPTQQ